MAKPSPAQFMQEVRQETRKVTWPTRRETMVSTALVFAMAILAAIFFLVVDEIIALGVKTILGLGG